MFILMHWAVVAEWLHQVVHVGTKTCMFKAMAHKQQLWALFYSTEDTHVEDAMRSDVLPQNGVGHYSLQLWLLPPTCVLQTGQRTATMEAGAILLDVILTWPSLHSERLLTQVLALFPHNTAGTDYVSEKLINSVSKFLTRFCRVTLSEHLDTCNLPVKHETMSLSDVFSQPPNERSILSFSFLWGTEVLPAVLVLLLTGYCRVPCMKHGPIRFFIQGNRSWHIVFITNVAGPGDLIRVYIKGSRTRWILMSHNWGVGYQVFQGLLGQSLSFMLVSGSTLETVTAYNVAGIDWQLGQTFAGGQFS